MDFSNISDDQYYCLGCRFFKDGVIDYKALAEELEEAKYYYAMFAFECEDVGFNARLLTYSPARWLFEGADYDATKEEFAELVKTETFKKFVSVLPDKIQTALGALQTVDENELKRNGIKKEDVDKLANSSLKIMTIVKAGCKNPTAK